MQSQRSELWLAVPSRRGFVNITPQVEQAVRESEIIEGLCLVKPLHITAAICIIDNESRLHQD